MRPALILAALLLAACPAGTGAPPEDAVDGGGDGAPGDGGVGCGQARGEFVPPECEPSGAKAEGACRCIIGWHFDGRRCAALGGCRCVERCDRVYADQGDCERAYARCLSR